MNKIGRVYDMGNELRPLGSGINIRYTTKDHLEYGEKNGYYRTYEECGEWICRQFDKINIISITDK